VVVPPGAPSHPVVQRYPLVRFGKSGSGREVTRVVRPEPFGVKMNGGDGGGGGGGVTRLQVPLRHAWAQSVHKAQGMSIDHLEVDLSNAFEPGQAYVALRWVYLIGFFREVRNRI
jgi:hypothetical protein